MGDLLYQWEQRGLAGAGLAHSIYSTEVYVYVVELCFYLNTKHLLQMFPLGLYNFDERDEVKELLGIGQEALVFLYCTVSQVCRLSLAPSPRGRATNRALRSSACTTKCVAWFFGSLQAPTPVVRTLAFHGRLAYRMAWQ